MVDEDEGIGRIGAGIEADRRAGPVNGAFALDLVIERARPVADADHERAARLASNDIGVGFTLFLEDILDQARKPLRPLPEPAFRGPDTNAPLKRPAGTDAGGGRV